MPRTGHRLRDFLTAPILDPGIMDAVSSSDTLLDYQQQPTPDLTKVDTGPTEISVTVDIPGLAFEVDGPFDPNWYEEAAEGEIKPKPIETEKETEKETQEETEKETQEETTPANYGIDRAEGFYCQANDTSYASAEEFNAKCQAPTSTLTPSTPVSPTMPGPTFTETITEAKSGGGGLLLLALALLGD
jgi:hypothetical protein